jgi:hypothetical protein
MEKLKSFEQFAKVKTENDKAQLQEEQNAKRESEANTFKDLLSEFNVTSVKELSEEQKSEFFTKLRGVEMNESFLIIEGTRGQFGKIDKRGNIESVYTHYDSYPDNMLPLIKKTYLKGGSPLNMVLKNGDNSGLEADPSGMNYYGGSDNMKGNVKNIGRYISTAGDKGGAEFIYLFDEKSGKWLMADIYAGDKDLKPAFESVVNESEAENILQDLLDERGGDMGELHGMEMEDALDTVESYGHKGSKAKKIAQELFSMCNESVVNEAIKVEGKRDAKKVVTQYNKILFSKLNAIGASNDKKTLLGAIKKLFLDSMEDANFHREREKCAGAIKGNIGSIPVIVDGLGKMSVNIGSTRIKDALEQEYSRISNAAGWSGQGIAEGTALFLEQCGFAKMGQDLLDRFNSFFEGEVKDNFEFRMFEAIKYAEGVLEASVVMDATDPGSKVLKKLLKKYKVTMEIIDNNGPSGWPEVELTGSREDLQSVLASDDGWGDPELGEYIEESNETFKIKVKALNEAKGDLTVGDKGVDYNDNVVEVIEIGKFKNIAKSFKKEMKADPADYGYEEAAGEFYLTKNIEATEGNVGDLAIYPVKYDMANYWGLEIIKESIVTEAEVTSDEEFKEYAFSVLKKAFGDDFDEDKAGEVVDGLISKNSGDYGAMVGALKSSLG